MRRNSLPDKFLLDPEITFLNHGSFGATPKVVFQEYQRVQRELENHPVKFLARELEGRLNQARQVLAKYLQATASNLIFVSNVTIAINIVARNLQLGPGDQVLTSDHEYGAMDRLWRFLSKRRGFEYIIRKVPTPVNSQEEIIEAIWRGVTDQTHVIFISHITSPTALRMPVDEICHRAREESILTVIDGAHAPGQIDLELDALGADFYGANLHKWLCAPKGSGFLYAKPEHHETLEPLIVSWGWESEKPGISLLADYHEWQGTRDPAAFLAVPTAIEFQQEHDWSNLRKGCHQLALAFQVKIAELTGIDPLSSPAFFEQMVSVQLPEVETEVLQSRLYDEYKLEIPVFLWNGVPLIRISVQGYNTRSDIERAIEAIRNLLR
jgi:isopenicillin-N epimerase